MDYKKLDMSRQYHDMSRRTRRSIRQHQGHQQERARHLHEPHLQDHEQNIYRNPACYIYRIQHLQVHLQKSVMLHLQRQRENNRYIYKLQQERVGDDHNNHRGPSNHTYQRLHQMARGRHELTQIWNKHKQKNQLRHRGARRKGR